MIKGQLAHAYVYQWGPLHANWGTIFSRKPLPRLFSLSFTTFRTPPTRQLQTSIYPSSKEVRMCTWYRWKALMIASLLYLICHTKTIGIWPQWSSKLIGSHHGLLPSSLDPSRFPANHYSRAPPLCFYTTRDLPQEIPCPGMPLFLHKH